MGQFDVAWMPPGAPVKTKTVEAMKWYVDEHDIFHVGSLAFPLAYLVQIEKRPELPDSVACGCQKCEDEDFATGGIVTGAFWTNERGLALVAPSSYAGADAEGEALLPS